MKLKVNEKIKLLSVSVFFLSTAFIQGCSIMPYKEESSCKFNEFGKCVPISDAYTEATTGLYKASINVNGTKQEGNINTHNNTKDISVLSDYQNSIYKKMQAMVDAQSMPLLKPAVVRRVLILPYKSADSDMWHESRHIYYIEQKPKWTLDAINLDKQNNINGFNLYQ